MAKLPLVVFSFQTSELISRNFNGIMMSEGSRSILVVGADNTSVDLS